LIDGSWDQEEGYALAVTDTLPNAQAAGVPARHRPLRQTLSSPELDRQAGKSGVTSWQLV
jgi:hypothetical protein